ARIVRLSSCTLQGRRAAPVGIGTGADHAPAREARAGMSGDVRPFFCLHAGHWCPLTQQAPRHAGLVALWAPAPDEAGTGGIRDSSSGADIEAATRLRRIWTHPVNTQPRSRHPAAREA